MVVHSRSLVDGSRVASRMNGHTIPDRTDTTYFPPVASRDLFFHKSLVRGTGFYDAALNIGEWVNRYKCVRV